MTLNGSALVDDLQLLLVGGDLQIISGDNGNDGEQSSCGLPALRAATGMVVCHVAAQGDFDFVGGTVAVEFAAGEVLAALRDSVVDEGVQRWSHFGWVFYLDWLKRGSEGTLVNLVIVKAPEYLGERVLNVYIYMSGLQRPSGLHVCLSPTFAGSDSQIPQCGPSYRSQRDRYLNWILRITTSVDSTPSAGFPCCGCFYLGRDVLFSAQI